jgi:hypothetical protein
MIAGLDQACNLILKRYLSEFGYKKKRMRRNEQHRFIWLIGLFFEVTSE